MNRRYFLKLTGFVAITPSLLAGRNPDFDPERRQYEQCR